MSYADFLKEKIKVDLIELYNGYIEDATDNKEVVDLVARQNEFLTMSLDELISANLVFVHDNEFIEFVKGYTYEWINSHE